MELYKPFVVLLRILLHPVHSTVGLKLVRNYWLWVSFFLPDLRIYKYCTLLIKKKSLQIIIYPS